jgi:hypothetical protein
VQPNRIAFWALVAAGAAGSFGAGYLLRYVQDTKQFLRDFMFQGEIAYTDTAFRARKELVVLKSLRSGDIQGATTTLETALDGDLSFIGEVDRGFSGSHRPGAVSLVLAEARAYRADHPSSLPPGAKLDALNSALSIGVGKGSHEDGRTP